MNYIELINNFWYKDLEHNFSITETALYFFLLKSANMQHWKNPIEVSNALIMAKFGLGRTSFKTAKLNLQTACLIDFENGNGRGNVCLYQIKVLEKASPNSTLSKKVSPNSTLYEHLSPVKVLEKASPNSTLYEHLSPLEPAPGAVLEPPLNIKHKTSKTLNKTTTTEKPPPQENFQVDVFANLESFKQAFLNDMFCTGLISQKGVELVKIPLWLDAFNRRLIFTGDTLKSERDYRSHFGNWLVKIPNYRNLNPADYNPIKDVPQQLDLGDKVIMLHNMSGNETTWTRREYEQYCNHAGTGYTFLRDVI